MTAHFYFDECGIKEYKFWFKILLGFAVLYSYITAMAFLLVHVEADVGNIKTYADAFWVLQMSASTIGFGDFYPVTQEGRLIIAVSFYVGVGIASYVGATIADIFIKFTDNSIQNRELKKQNAEILEKMDVLMRHLNLEEKHVYTQ